jgi:hypothetical protein
MSELSCDTPFIGRNDTDDLILYLLSSIYDACIDVDTCSHQRRPLSRFLALHCPICTYV